MSDEIIEVTSDVPTEATEVVTEVVTEDTEPQV